MSIISAGGAVVGSAEAGGYQIERSLRFNSADSAYLNRTPASAGNRKTWTYSIWFKLSAITGGSLLTGTGTSDVAQIRLNASSRLNLNYGDTANNYFVTPAAQLRDVGAWYHVVWVTDTSQATAANRAKVYINGEIVTAFQSGEAPANLPLDQECEINTATVHKIGQQSASGGFFNGYMAEINFVDGQALDATDFGEFNTDTGVWQPKAYTGSYGTNGFYLNFSDNASTTTLGDDLSGNGNDWTTNNFSVTAGAGNDSLVDTPTRYGTDTGVGGEVRGNYCTGNPLQLNGGSLANGNLDITTPSSGDGGVIGTFQIPASGKWYWEFVQTSAPGSYCFSGIGSVANYNPGLIYYGLNGNKYVDGSATSYGATYGQNDVIGVAVDVDGGEVTFYKNGVSQGAITYASSGLFPYVHKAGGSGAAINVTANFGQRPFAHTAPSGFKALVTTNLPTPTIEDGGDYFNTVLYTGNGSTQSITGVGFQPDWVITKTRSISSGTSVADAVRGASNLLGTATTAAEVTQSAGQGITSFDSDGFSLGTDASIGSTNFNGATYVAWNWKANGAGVSNTAGTITSTVSANTDSGFSIVTYTGNGTGGATVGHGLGVAPSMVILKPRSIVDGWPVYHSAYAATQTLYLQLTNALSTNSTIWNDTAPTSSVFTIGSNNNVNQSTETYVAYCFAAIPGYSAFGSYVGNGSADGPFIYTGFRPAFVLVKSSTSIRSWVISDGVRNPYNVTNLYLVPNSSSAEGTNNLFDFTSNGFKVRDSLVGINESGETFIYAAFAESPFKYSLGR